ncbi:hypothetical protein D3C87_1267400 [compost metagenome]
MRQQAQQIARGYRQRSGTDFQRWRQAAANVEQQGLQRGENLLDIVIDGQAGRGDGPIGRFDEGAVGSARGTTHRGRFKVRQHTGCEQQLIGFSVKPIGVAQDITLEQPEDDQLDLDLQPQLACSLQEVFAEHRRAHGVVQIAQRLA